MCIKQTFWSWLVRFALCLVLMVGAARGFAACQQISISASYFSSWDTHGYENRVYRDEVRYPDSLVGRGPGSDRRDYTKLAVSKNILGFQIPLLTGAVVNAELQLRVRYLISFRGSELYQWGALANPQVKLNVHRALLSNVYDDPDNTIYGAAPVTVYDSLVSVPLNDDFINLATAAAGQRFLMEGSLTTLDNDPQNREYLYLETTLANYAVLVLTLSNAAAPQIVTHPTSKTVNEGTEADFHVVACGAPPLSYQWLLNGVSIAGATSSSLLLKNVAFYQQGNYSVIVSNAAGAATSATAHLTVNQSAPFFAVQPLSLTNSVDATGLQMRAVAGGAPLPVYQWRLDGTNIPGATNNILHFDLATPSVAGTYTVVASNVSGSVTSNPAFFKVVPFFLYGPGNRSALLDNFTGLYAWYSGNVPPTYVQWFHNGSPIAGATNMNYEFIATPEFAGSYFVVAGNEYGSVTGQVAIVTVQAQAPFFSSLVYSQSLVAGFPAEIYAPAYGGSPPVLFWYHDGALISNQNGPGLSFASVAPADAGQYTVVASNQLGYATNGPFTITVVPARLSVSPSTLNVGEGMAAAFETYYQGIAPVSFQWYFEGLPLLLETNSVLSFLPATLAQTGAYTVSASNAFGVVTSLGASLSVYSNPASVSLAFSAVTNRVGDFVWLPAFVGGAPPPTCQWQFNGTNIPGATNYVLALSNVSTQHSGMYVVIVTNGVGLQLPASAFVWLQVNEPTPLDDWTFLNPRPQANPLRGIAFGNGRRVAVGENGAVVVSTDGQAWTTRHLGKGIHLNAVAFGNGMFVAAGSALAGGNQGLAWYSTPVILTSPDGVTWTSRELSAAREIIGVAFGNGRFVAIGASDYFGYDIRIALTSTDGVHWQKHYLRGNITTASLSGITFGHGRFVAVSDGGYLQRIALSVDGMNWIDGIGASGHDYEAVCAGANGFVAVGDQGVVARSADGILWSIGAMPTNTPLKAVAFGNGTYVAAGDGGVTYKSADAISWERVTTPNVHDIRSLTFGADQVTAVADAGRILASSNSVNWTDQCLGPDVDLYAIVKGPPGYVAVGEDALQFSSDRVNWTVISASRKLHHVTYANGLYVAVGKRGLILTSPDGLTWTERASGVNQYIEHVIWANNRFVAVGEAGLMTTSTNGINWTALPPPTLGDLEDVTYGNGMFVAVGGYFGVGGAIATVLTSTNGIVWQDQPSVAFFGVRARGVTFGNGKFVLVGNDGLTAVSTNGKSWSDAFQLWENFRSVTYTAGRFVAVGNDGLVMSSLDGTVWNYQRCPASMNLRDVQTVEDGVIVLGSNGAILKSDLLQPQLFGHKNGGGFELNVRGGFAAQYQLQSSTDLLNWSNIMAYSNSAPMHYLDPSGAPRRFYRLVPAP